VSVHRRRGVTHRNARREAVWGYAFVLAPFVGFALFGLGPLIASAVLSFFDYDLLTPPRWTGAGNYARLFGGDPLFWTTLGNTLFFLLGIPVGLALSLALALALNQSLAGRALFRTIYYLPSVTSVVAISLLWLWIFNPEFGVLNQTLARLGIPGPLWLQDKRWVKPALMLMGVWGGLGPSIVLYLAGLQGVPQSLIEAATVDGANGWQRFRHVIWPGLTPTTFFLAVMGVMGTLQMFGQIYIMTEGGPEFASATTMYYLWQNAFNYNKMGYASALAWVLGALIMALTAVQFAVARRWVHYEPG
jgi:arabinooligosaccharide transport system permease protein